MSGLRERVRLLADIWQEYVTADAHTPTERSVFGICAEALRAALAAEERGGEWTFGDEDTLPLRVPRRAWLVDTMGRGAEWPVMRTAALGTRFAVPEAAGPSGQRSSSKPEQGETIPGTWEMIAHRPLAAPPASAPEGE